MAEVGMDERSSGGRKKNVGFFFHGFLPFLRVLMHFKRVQGAPFSPFFHITADVLFSHDPLSKF